MSVDRISLILCLDCNRVHSLYNEKILYENEAIQACIQWRRNAGWLKDIQIFGICNCIGSMSSRTIEKLKSLNVKILSISKFSDYPLYNKVYAQYWFEANFRSSYDYAIYSDLDFQIKRELPGRMFANKSVFMTYFNPFDKLLDKNQAFLLYHRYNNIVKNNGKVFNTMFSVHYLKNGINKCIYDAMSSEKYKKFYDEFIHYPGYDYYLEEGLYDFLYHENIINSENSLMIKITSFITKYYWHQHLYASNLDFNSLIRETKKQ